jgi:uncharacterized protein (TIGR03435 family)
MLIASRKAFRTLVLMLLPAMAPGQPRQPSLRFESVRLEASRPQDPVATLGILPNGHIEFHNVTLRKIVAAAYAVAPEMVTGGPAWIDSRHFDLIAKAPAGTTQADRLSMLQAFLADRFKLALHRDKKIIPVYVLALGKDGPKVEPSASGGVSDCIPVAGDPKQLHLRCRSVSMSDLADWLSQRASNYLRLPVVDRTGLKGTYDLQLDWMGKFSYDAAARTDSGAPKDPLAVSIFDAVSRIGLTLNQQEEAADIVVIDNAQYPFLQQLTQKSASTGLSRSQVGSVDRLVLEEMARQHIPGSAVGIYRRGAILMAKGYGLANVELKVPVNPETVFQSGSVGKQFTSAAVMLLAEEGKIGLEDSVTKYLPDAPASWRPILIQNLLSHTSGLAEYESPERIVRGGEFYLRLDFSEDELVKKIEALPIEFAPGERWDYRNTNYLLLGIIIHKITGERYSDYLQEKIFRPWYMTATRLISEKEIIPDRAAGYEWVNGKLRNQEWVSPTFNSTADGTLYFNVLDLAKWDEALYGTSLLRQSSLDRIWTVFPLKDGNPNPADYGFGWRITQMNGHKVIEHDGGWQGFACAIYRYVDDNLTVVVLTNLAQADPNLMVETIAGLVNPALAASKSQKVHREVTVDPKILAGYVGRYELSPEFSLTVTLSNGHLFIQGTDQPAYPLYADNERDFFMKGEFNAEMTFVTDVRGRATELVLHQAGDKHAKRVE